MHTLTEAVQTVEVEKAPDGMRHKWGSHTHSGWVGVCMCVCVHAMLFVQFLYTPLLA